MCLAWVRARLRSNPKWNRLEEHKTLNGDVFCIHRRDEERGNECATPTRRTLAASLLMVAVHLIMCAPAFAEPSAVHFVASRQESLPKNESTTSVQNALASLSTDISLSEGTLPDGFHGHLTPSTLQTVDRRMQEGWAISNVPWAASCLHHRPLYFEEINAERYGYSRSYLFQPVISASRFFLTIPLLPYKMAVESSCRCQYTLGHYRPGSCAPWQRHRLPVRAQGIAGELFVVAGLILLIP